MLTTTYIPLILLSFYYSVYIYLNKDSTSVLYLKILQHQYELK